MRNNRIFKGDFKASILKRIPKVETIIIFYLTLKYESLGIK